MLARLIALLATGEAGVIKRRVKTAVIAYVALAISVVVALVFLLLAAYLAAAVRWGAIDAAVGFGLGFAGLAVLIFVGFKVVAGAQRRAQQHRRAADTTMVAGASAVAMLPALLGKKGGAAGLLLILAGLAGYGAYRQYVHRSGKGLDRPD